MPSGAAADAGIDMGASSGQHGNHGRTGEVFGQPLTATSAIRQLFSSEDPSALFRQLDEDFIKPKLLLDGGGRGNGGGSGGGPH
jgi:sodium/hydrogen exchanger-like protein 6/7